MTIGKLTQLYPGVGSGAPASALLLCLQGVHRSGGQECGLMSLGVSPKTKLICKGRHYEERKNKLWNSSKGIAKTNSFLLRNQEM